MSDNDRAIRYDPLPCYEAVCTLRQFGRATSCHLTTYQRYAVAVDMLPFLEAEARQRQGTRTDLKDIPPQTAGSFSDSRDVAAKQVNVGHTGVSEGRR